MAVKAKKSTGAKVAQIIISVIVAIAIIFGICYYFGIPHRLINCITIDGESYSVAEYSYYYSAIYSTYYQYSSYYGEEYAEGFDYTVDPTLQSIENDDGETVTFAQYFAEEAVEQMASVKRYYNAALEAGIELDDDDYEEIEEALEQFDSYLGNYSLSAYLTLQYGRGVTASVYEQIITEQTYAEKYTETIEESLETDISEDDIVAERESDPTAYDVADIRWYTIDIDTDADDEDAAILEAEELAAAFVEDVVAAGSTEDAFKEYVLEYLDEDDDEYEDNYEAYSEDSATVLNKLDYDTFESSISDDAADWIFETDDDGNYAREVSDISYFTNDDEDTVYIFMITATPYQDDTKPRSVRHILIEFPETDDDEEVSADDKASTYEEAEAVLQEYLDYLEENDLEMDEDEFSSLAESYSEDSGTSSDGGLIEDMINDGTYVEDFEDWVFCEGEYEGETRETGDYAIIETEYGYHVMYFVSEDEYSVWYQTIYDDLLDEIVDEYWEEFEAQFSDDDVTTVSWLISWVRRSRT